MKNICLYVTYKNEVIENSFSKEVDSIILLPHFPKHIFVKNTKILHFLLSDNDQKNTIYKYEENDDLMKFEDNNITNMISKDNHFLSVNINFIYTLKKFLKENKKLFIEDLCNETEQLNLDIESDSYYSADEFHPILYTQKLNLNKFLEQNNLFKLEQIRKICNNDPDVFKSNLKEIFQKLVEDDNEFEKFSNLLNDEQSETLSYLIDLYKNDINEFNKILNNVVNNIFNT